MTFTGFIIAHRLCRRWATATTLAVADDSLTCTFLLTAISSEVACLAFTFPSVDVAFSLLTLDIAFVLAAVLTEPARVTAACSLRRAKPMATALFGTCPYIALCPGPQTHTLALPLRCITRAVGTTGKRTISKLACLPGERLEALALAQDASSPLVACGWASFGSTISTAEALGTLAFTSDEVAEAILGTRIGATAQLAELSDERIFALAFRGNSVSYTLSIPMAVIDAALDTTVFADKARRAPADSFLKIALTVSVAVVGASLILTLPPKEEPSTLALATLLVAFALLRTLSRTLLVASITPHVTNTSALTVCGVTLSMS